MTRQAPETGPRPYRPGHPKKGAFLAAYRQTGIILTACRQAEVPRSTYYWWTEHDAAFAAACEQAKTEAIEQVEAELRRRALLKGPKTRDTTALIFYLKAHKPEKYRERFDMRHEDRLPPQIMEMLRELALTTRG